MQQSRSCTRARLSLATWCFRVGPKDRTCQSLGLASHSCCSRCWRSRSPQAPRRLRTRKKSIWGPAEVKGVSQFPIYKDLGVGIWQNRINWSDVAPTGHQPAESARSRLPLVSRAGRRDRGGQALRHPHLARPVAGPGVGERSPTPASCLESRRTSRTSRTPRRLLPVRPTLDDLERADPSPELQATHQREARPSRYPENEARRRVGTHGFSTRPTRASRRAREGTW